MKNSFSLVAVGVSLSLTVPFLFAGGDAKTTGDPKQHWAFLPPRQPAVPSVQREELVRTAVDRFLEAALEQKGLSLGPEADRPTLLRRVSFDLTGLPPTPADTAALLTDTSADAYDRMVERYLASPHYGEITSSGRSTPTSPTTASCASNSPATNSSV